MGPNDIGVDSTLLDIGGARRSGSPLGTRNAKDDVVMEFVPHRRLADVEGYRLHWIELGESTAKPPLLLLHGLADCWRASG